MAKNIVKNLHKAIKSKKCAECNAEFTPYKTTDKWCSIACVVEGAKKKVWKQEKVKRIDKLRTRTEWLNLLQVCINDLVRHIDYGHSCISCGGDGKPQAGHYHSTQANPTLRFHLFNIWLQDYRCNVELSANIIGYNKGLALTFGNDLKHYVEAEIVNNHRVLKLTESELKEKISIVKEILRDLPKETKYTTEGRIKLRHHYQSVIGI